MVMHNWYEPTTKPRIHLGKVSLWYMGTMYNSATILRFFCREVQTLYRDETDTQACKEPASNECALRGRGSLQNHAKVEGDEGRKYQAPSSAKPVCDYAGGESTDECPDGQDGDDQGDLASINSRVGISGACRVQIWEEFSSPVRHDLDAGYGSLHVVSGRDDWHARGDPRTVS